MKSIKNKLNQIHNIRHYIIHLHKAAATLNIDLDQICSLGSSCIDIGIEQPNTR